MPLQNKMNKFKGFTESETFTQLPDTFFHQILKQIEDVAELKVTLYLIWRVEHMEGPFRALSRMDFNVKDLGLPAEEITHGLKKAVQRGTLLEVQRETALYFLLNSPRGRATAQAIQSGQWNPKRGVTAPLVERPNIFKLYEENIGPLTPMIADALKDAEDAYSVEWIEDAIEEAVLHNARNWKYCEAILRDWKENGRGKKQDRRDTEKVDRDDIQKRVDEFFKR